jgi:hypothetical protein
VKTATCHPDRPVHARGLCLACYEAAWKTQTLDTYPLKGRAGKTRVRREDSLRQIAALLKVTPPTVALARSQGRLRNEGGRWVVEPAKVGRPKTRPT